MEVVATLLAFVALIAVWFVIARSMKRKNVHFILRHIFGAVVGTFAMVSAVAVFIAAGVIESSSDAEDEVVATASSDGVNTDTQVHPKPVVEAVQTPGIEQEQPKAQVASGEQGADLGFTAEEFYARFNNAVAPLDLPFKAPAKPTITSGQVKDSFTFMLDDYIGITGSINKHNSMINSLMLTGVGDGTADSGARIILTSAAMFMAATDDLSDSGKKAATDTLLRLFDKQKSSDDNIAKTYRSGLQFMIASPEGLGTWISVSPAD